jgi:hypothetical protein
MKPTVSKKIKKIFELRIGSAFPLTTSRQENDTIRQIPPQLSQKPASKPKLASPTVARRWAGGFASQRFEGCAIFTIS